MELPYRAEYAKSARSSCHSCKLPIAKDTLRLALIVQSLTFDGPSPLWYHFLCFFEKHRPKTIDDIEHVESLRIEDQDKINEKIIKTTAMNVPNKRGQKRGATGMFANNEGLNTQSLIIKQKDGRAIKKPKNKDDDALVEEAKKQDKVYADQNKMMFKHRDNLKYHLKKDELVRLLQENHQNVPVGVDKMLDRLADNMTFGVLEPCMQCNGGQLVFNKFGYLCTGYLTNWTKCNNTEKEPKRRAFKVPYGLKENYGFLKIYKYVPRTRIIKDVKPSIVQKEEDEVNGKPKIERKLPPLYNMEFVIFGNPKHGKVELEKEIAKLGGKVTMKISKSVMAVIATKDDVKQMGKRMKEVEESNVQVVPEEFIDYVKDDPRKITELIVEITICDWGSDPNTRLPPEPYSRSKQSKSSSIYTKSLPSKVKLKLKGGNAVDPDSCMQHFAHVYEEGSDKYSVILGVTDIQSNKNSYYKMQLLEEDKCSRLWLFRSWGRIGTIIGDTQLEDIPNKKVGVEKFCQLYEEKTGNNWLMRDDFVKVPGRMYPIDVDYGNDNLEDLQIVDKPSTLPTPVQKLIKLIFDVKAMEKVMLEFELDIEKMPLGKLSQNQIIKAFAVLTELYELIENGRPTVELIDASNRFYTLVPHSFGLDNPPVLNDKDIIKTKLDMLASLSELEITYSLMQSSGSKHTIDSYYEQLHTEITVLDPDSAEYKIISEYAQNTHAETHRSYELNIIDIFAIKRKDEDKRFNPFKKLHNRKLLWHGSRITNFAGILAHGLRIAPPEAPVTGYMFGKGIYFADMVSKSANYCCTSPSSPTGLLLLCDVALGNLYERSAADYITKLPKGKHSTKGIGRTAPDQSQVKEIDGAEVPMGKGVANNEVNVSLLYNEFIVYDVAQVNVKYLLRMEFKY